MAGTGMGHVTNVDIFLYDDKPVVTGDYDSFGASWLTVIVGDGRRQTAVRFYGTPEQLKELGHAMLRMGVAVANTAARARRERRRKYRNGGAEE